MVVTSNLKFSSATLDLCIRFFAMYFLGAVEYSLDFTERDTNFVQRNMYRINSQQFF